MIIFSRQVPPAPFGWQISGQAAHRDISLARHSCPMFPKQVLGEGLKEAAALAQE